MTDPATYDASPRRDSTLDRVVTVVLLLGLGLLVPVAGFLGLMTGMASDGCMASTCNDTLMTLGISLSAGSFAVVGVAAFGWVVARWSRGRSTWWVPLVGLVVAAAGWALGALITFSAVG